MKQEIIVICAMTNTFGIGYKNTLPWKLKPDMDRFVKLTTGYPVIMGRKTFQSLKSPLKNRQNIVISNTSSFIPEGALKIGSLWSAINSLPNQRKIFIIGGKMLFSEAANIANKAYLTIIDSPYQADCFFPANYYTKKNGWKYCSSVTHRKTDEHPQYTFLELSRVLSFC